MVDDDRSHIRADGVKRGKTRVLLLGPGPAAEGQRLLRRLVMRGSYHWEAKQGKDSSVRRRERDQAPETARGREMERYRQVN